MSENHVRGSPPGSPFGHHFGTENDKMHEKVVPDEGLGRNRRVKRNKSEKWGHPGRAHMQSDCACAVKTHFSVFGACPNKAPKRAPLDSSLETFWHKVRFK